MPFSGWPWYAQLIGFIVVAIIVVYLFVNVVVPLLKTVT